MSENSILEDVKKILEIAVFAPSGDNSQPWAFEVQGNVIRILNVPEKDTSFYNFNQNANFIAIGALLENIIIFSHYLKYDTQINIFPREDKKIVAEITLSEGQNVESYLYEYIKKRHTNRKPYFNQVIDIKFKEEVKRLNTESIKFLINEDEFTKSKIAEIASLNEKIILEDKHMHNFLFEHITWNEAEDKEKKGFFVKTLELKFPQFLALKIFSSWRRLSFFKKFIPVSSFIAKENAKTYAKSGGFLAITGKNLTPENFVEVGRLFQRAWLIITKNGLVAQPLTGITLLAIRCLLGGEDVLLKSHRDLVIDGYKKLKEYFHTKEEVIILLRVGYAPEVSSKTSRHSPIIKY